MKTTEGADCHQCTALLLPLSKLDDIENENMERFGWMSERKGDTLGLEEGDKEKTTKQPERIPILQTDMQERMDEGRIKGGSPNRLQSIHNQ